MKNLIKENNLRILRGVLRKERTATKARLSELTGISVVTIQSLLQTLMEAGEVKEDEMIKPQLGRPAVSYRFCECAKLILVIYMLEKNKKDTAVFSIVNLYGEVIEEFEQQFEVVELCSFDVGIESVLQTYDRAKGKNAVSLISLGLPGIAHEGKVLFSDYEKLRGKDLGGYLKERYEIPVIIENDINVATYGYASSLDENLSTCVVGIYMPSKYPPGAGICQKGEIVRGKSGLAGEIANLPLGIDWATFDYEKEAVDNFLIQTIRIMVCLYNPPVVILYDEREERKQITEKLHTQMKSDVEKMMLPQVVVKENMKEDFRKGMIRLSLSEVLEAL